MSTTIHYHLLNAFNTKPFSGNQAAVIILDQETKEKIDSQKLHQAITDEIKAPATAFVIPQSDSTYHISWWYGAGEINLCGHATLATSKILFDRLNASVVKDDPKVKVIEYKSGAGKLQAKLLKDDRIELEFPAAQLVPLSESYKDEEIEDIRSKIQACVQDETVNIAEIKRGKGEAFDSWLLVELDLSKTSHQSLKDIKINHGAIESLQKYSIEKFSLTTRGSLSPSQTSGSPTDFHIVSRAFHPIEDAVTGSMHCLLAPYWTCRFRESNPSPGNGDPFVIRARQASPREGVLEVVWKEKENTVLIRGDAYISGKGELIL